MKREEFKQLILSIFDAQDVEILCSEFFELLPRFVELQLSERNAASLLPQVRHHLQQCPECNEVYQALLQTTQSEENT